MLCGMSLFHGILSLFQIAVLEKRAVFKTIESFTSANNSIERKGLCNTYKNKNPKNLEGLLHYSPEPDVWLVCTILSCSCPVFTEPFPVG